MKTFTLKGDRTGVPHEQRHSTIHEAVVATFWAIQDQSWCPTQLIDEEDNTVILDEALLHERASIYGEDNDLP